MDRLSRRAFLLASMRASAACVVSVGISGCNWGDGSGLSPVMFTHGVASGDPLDDAVILWTRAVPLHEVPVTVSWEVATDADFTDVINRDSTTTDAGQDYTVKVDVQGLMAGTRYYYRFKANGTTSVTGETKTLPAGDVSQVRLALFSCAMWEHGYFHAYRDALTQDVDAVIHNGDYIYEYGSNQYSAIYGEPVRIFEPTHEIITLDDYRLRYNQYRTDADLQALHRKFPWIVIWDDHEIANDVYKDGAENHTEESEGSFVERKAAALQAYYEWLPIRPQNPLDRAQAYRSFDFGNLVSLHMLETRLLARAESAAGKQEQLSLITDEVQLAAAMQDLIDTLSDSSRKLIGDTQFNWLQSQMTNSIATWQVLGQQVMMAEMKLPQSILLFDLDTTDFVAIGALIQLYKSVVAALPGADEATIQAAVDAQLESAVVQGLMSVGLSQAEAEALAPVKVEKLNTLEAESKIAYNLDAWDGYPYEQLAVMALAAQLHQAKATLGLDSNLIVLTGDSHNAWANNLRYREVDFNTGVPTGNLYDAGVEIGTTSVSSIGMETSLKAMLVGAGIISEEQFDIDLFTGIFNYYIDDNVYTELEHRGYTVLTFTPEQAVAEFRLIADAISPEFNPDTDVMTTTVTVKNGANRIDSVV